MSSESTNLSINELINGFITSVDSSVCISNGWLVETREFAAMKASHRLLIAIAFLSHCSDTEGIYTGDTAVILL